MFSLYTYREKCPAHWQPCLSPIWTIFEFVRDINKTNVLTNFHDDWAKNVTSRVYTSHVIQLTETIFELNSHIKETNVLTKFHENWAKNVTSRVFTCINKTNVLTNFHDDWAKIVTSRVFTRKTAPPPPPPPPRQPYYSTDRNHFHVIQLIETIFELNSHIKETNVLTKFHENWAKKPCLSPIWTIFEFVRHINKTNVLTNFHDDWAKIVTSRPYYSTDRNHFHVIQLIETIFELNSHIKETNVLTKFHENWAKKKNAPPTGSHVYHRSGPFSNSSRHINKTNVLTNFHDDWAKNVTSRVYTSHVIQLTETIFELNSHIKETNVLTKFHENWAKNVTSRVFTCLNYIHIEKNAPPTGGHVYHLSRPFSNLSEVSIKPMFLPTFMMIGQKLKTAPLWQPCYSTDRNHFRTQLSYQGNKINVLTKFHENWAKNVTSRVFTCFYYIHIEKNAPPTGSHVFSPIWTIFELVRDINKTNVLTNFHDDWAKIVTSRVFTSHVIQLTRIISKLNSHNIEETNALTKFQENWEKNVNFRVFTCFHYIHIEKNAQPTGGHVFSPIWTIFKLVRNINKTNPNKENCPAHWRPYFIGTKLLTKFHEDRTINVASRVFTNKCGRTTDNDLSQKLT
ncbi:hypothetical protein DPMN_073357 [Dreissena polymorpha]|uniref:Uncharacterized protein n=1 Tax=Dreissena polymorpha TaxID=45954 RepID=A0A9D4HDV7_DREPO|nr:hypothetical protein DPMN_073357 [Dreissena polymorpha]